MKRTPFKRRQKPLRSRKAEGPDRVREVKPWAAPTVRSLHVGTYAGGTAAAVPKTEPMRCEAYRRLMTPLNCMVCGRTPCQAAHPNTGKGMGTKADDRECFPLCPDCHRRFDQGALFTKEARRELEPAWGAQTRYSLMQAGLVPPRIVALLKLQPDGSYA